MIFEKLDDETLGMTDKNTELLEYLINCNFDEKKEIYFKLKNDGYHKSLLKTFEIMSPEIIIITKEELIDFECDGRCCCLDLVYPNSDAGLACDEECYYSKSGDGRRYLMSAVKRNVKAFRECIDFKNNNK